MAKYINADVLIDTVKRYISQWSNQTGDYKYGVLDAFEVFMSTIFAQPAADVRENAHGEWIEDEVQTHIEKTYHCCVCGFGALGEGEKTDFCGGCGSDMRGWSE